MMIKPTDRSPRRRRQAVKYRGDKPRGFTVLTTRPNPGRRASPTLSKRVQRAIKDFDLRGDPSVFEEVSCACERTWEEVTARETAYNMPLAR